MSYPYCIRNKYELRIHCDVSFCFYKFVFVTAVSIKLSVIISTACGDQFSITYESTGNSHILIGLHTVTVPSNRLVPGPENIFQLGLRVLFLSKCLARGTVKYLEKKIEFWKQKLKIIAKKYV